MARKRVGRSSSGRGSGGGAGNVVLAFLLGAGVAAGGGYLYLHSTPGAPVAPAPVASVPSPVSRTEPGHPAPPAKRPTAPFGISEDVFEGGAHLYVARCASCHGTPQNDAAGHANAPQLWRKARPSLATRAPGDLYTEIAAGAPAKGMPGYASVLTDREIWQVALLLKNGAGELPDPVTGILNERPNP